MTRAAGGARAPRVAHRPLHRPRPLGRPHAHGRQRPRSPRASPRSAAPSPAWASNISWATRPQARGRSERAQPHPPRSPRQRAAPRRDHHCAGRQSLPARAIPARLQRGVRPAPGGSRRPPSCPSAASTSSRSSASKRSASSAATMSSRLDRVALQLAKQPGRRTCAGLRVLVRRHLSGHYLPLVLGGRCLGRYDRPRANPSARPEPLMSFTRAVNSRCPNSCGQITYQ